MLTSVQPTTVSAVRTPLVTTRLAASSAPAMLATAGMEHAVMVRMVDAIVTYNILSYIPVYYVINELKPAFSTARTPSSTPPRPRIKRRAHDGPGLVYLLTFICPVYHHLSVSVTDKQMCKSQWVSSLNAP